MSRPKPNADLATGVVLTDASIVERVLQGEGSLFEILIRRHNQQVFRVARAILGNEHEAEDVMQDAYVRAYHHLSQFEGRSSFATWLTRIAVYEALSRKRQRERLVALPADPADEEAVDDDFLATGLSPDHEAHGHQLRPILTAALDALSEAYRLVFVLREIEGLTTDETSRCLGISEENVRVRLHRARSSLRQGLGQLLGEEARNLYPFHLRRCGRVAEVVLARLGLD